jgi:WS/DGAT/MGAT family acyltransferase
MSSTTMPAADAAWLHMDSPTNPMVVNSLVWFDEPIDWERVKAIYEDRLVSQFPRFRRRVVESVGGRPRFEDDPEFDLEQHMHRRALPAPGDQAALQELVSDLITPPLDPTRPLWHAYLIEGYGEGCALLSRIHHCVADGMALARLMLSLTDAEPDVGFAPPAAESTGSRMPLQSIVRPATAAVSTAGRVASAAVHESMESLAHPRHLAHLASIGARDAGTLAKLMASPADSPTMLKGPLHGTRRVAWSTAFPLERIRRAAHRSNAKVNDVLVAAVTGALRAELARHDEAPDEVRAMVPFNLRALDEPLPRDLGNLFALVLLALPVGTEDPGERLREVKMRMDAIKDSHEGPIAYGILSVLGTTPPAVEDRLIGLFSGKASAVVTNVPGPSEPVFLAGSPVRRVLVWAPCSGSIGMTVSIFSYAGDVTVGFMTDIALVPDPQPLVDDFDAELRALCRRR